MFNSSSSPISYSIGSEDESNDEKDVGGKGRNANFIKFFLYIYFIDGKGSSDIVDESEIIERSSGGASEIDRSTGSFDIGVEAVIVAVTMVASMVQTEVSVKIMEVLWRS